MQVINDPEMLTWQCKSRFARNASRTDSYIELQIECSATYLALNVIVQTDHSSGMT